jgi:4-amino-4-deoxy-L-arabinose transferase-like glycosyltransferase
MRLIEGAAIVTAVAASWYVLALNQAGWEFFHRQILNENIYRFFDSEQGGPSRDHAWYYYGPALCAGMFPWSLFFPALIHFLYRAREELREPRLRYLLVWVLAGLIFFTLASGKRTNYILPLYPAVALLFAVWWEALVEDTITSSIWAMRLARINAFILSAVFALLLLLPSGSGKPSTGRLQPSKSVLGSCYLVTHHGVCYGLVLLGAQERSVDVCLLGADSCDIVLALLYERSVPSDTCARAHL